jgi:hypothetical protein
MKVILTETKFKLLVAKLVNEGEITEQGFLKAMKKVFGYADDLKLLTKSIDEYKTALRQSKEFYTELDKFYNRAIEKNNLNEISDMVSTIYYVFNPKGDSKLEEYATRETYKMLDAYASLKGKGNFKELRNSILKPQKTLIKQLSAQQFVDKFKLGDVGFPKEFNGLRPDQLTSAQKTKKAELDKHWDDMANIAISNLDRRINNISNKSFNPSKVNVISQSNVSGREIIEVQIENGEKIIFYKSSGSNVGTTGKQKGEWFVIPGFMDNCISVKKETNTFRVFDNWFCKTDESIALTKGGNSYLTQMAKFLENNGVEALSK